MKNKIYKSNYKLLVESFFILCFMLFAGVMGNGVPRQFKLILCLCVALLFITYIEKVMKYCKIKSNGLVKIGTGIAFGYQLNLEEIIEVNRTPAFRIKGWGARLHFKARLKDGSFKYAAMKETNYNLSVLKALFQDLVKRNPSVKLHPQYQDLIDGKIENEKKFKKLPIEPYEPYDFLK